MCLISKKYIAKIAQKDIECYKVMVCDIDGTYATPFQGTKIPDNIMKGDKEFVARGFISRYKDSITKNIVIGSGVIHTFANQASAEFISSRLSKPHNRQVFKCIIPRGTRYFIDTHGGEYASKRIRFVQRVN